MIKITKPYIQDNENKSRLICNININDEDIKTLYFEVDSKYKDYLCFERSDAFLIAVLPFALRKNHDIFCEEPVSEQLLYNIQEILIPSLYNNDKNIHNIKIDAKTDNVEFASAFAVGTGMSCGVDSFHVIHNMYKSKYEKLSLTHLCLNSVGSFHHGYDKYGHDKIIEDCIDAARKVSKELGLELIITNSNLSEDTFGFKSYDLVHTYFNMFAVYCLQKFWKIYFYASSGYAVGDFSLKNNSIKDCAFYELLSLQCFSTQQLQIYSEGITKNRLQKTETIANDNLTYKYLHVCTTNGKNCGICEKCKRTILTLYAIDKLSLYKDVFNLDYFYNNFDIYLEYLFVNKKSKFLCEIYKILKNKISLYKKIKFYIKHIIFGLLKAIYNIK